MPDQRTFNIHLGLEQVRRERALSLKQMHALAAQRLPGLPLSRLSRFSLGYAHPDWTEICALAEAFGVTPEQLAGLPPPKPAAVAAAPVAPAPKASMSPPPPPSIAAPVFPEAPPQIPGRGQGPAEQYRELLGKELHKATQALHIPKLPAKLWAGWRGYEQALRRELLAMQRGAGVQD